MDVVTEEKFSLNNNKLALAIGSFDGLHLGHKAIIDKLIGISKKNNLKAGVFSFNPHPMQVMAPERFPGLLISEEQKHRLLEELDVDIYFSQKFNRKFAQTSFKKFIEKVLVQKLKIKNIVVGDDFKFGHNRSGDIEDLREMGNKHSFQTTIVRPVKINNHKVSSTLIRNLIENKKISTIPKYLGRFYQIQGKVISGHNLGRKLGIPTANLEPICEYVLPPRGVYAVYVNYRGHRYKGIMNLGYRPTFSGEDYSIEVHILDFNDNLYGQKLTVDMVEYIRAEKSFAGSEQLVKQIKKDILYTDRLLCYNE